MTNWQRLDRGRRKEFSEFWTFKIQQTGLIPEPQALTTFTLSKLSGRNLVRELIANAQVSAISCFRETT